MLDFRSNTPSVQLITMFGQTAFLSVVCCTVSISSTVSAATIIADSQADFSGNQGQDNWYYGYYDGPFEPMDFQEMAQFNGTAWTVDSTLPSPYVWTTLYDIGGSPNGQVTSGGRDAVEHWAVRRYVSSFAGNIVLSGILQDIDPNNPGITNGVIGHIFVGGIEVYSAVAENDASEIPYEIVVQVSNGTTIDFAIDPRLSHDGGDNTQFTAVISASMPPGDGNGDGWVDGIDYLIWASNFGTHPGADGDISDGDYNDDGWVDGIDYLLWAGDFGTHSSTAVPEPTSLTMALLALVGLLVVSRRG